MCPERRRGRTSCSFEHLRRARQPTRPRQGVAAPDPPALFFFCWHFRFGFFQNFFKKFPKFLVFFEFSKQLFNKFPKFPKILFFLVTFAMKIIHRSRITESCSKLASKQNYNWWDAPPHKVWASNSNSKLIFAKVTDILLANIFSQQPPCLLQSLRRLRAKLQSLRRLRAKQQSLRRLRAKHQSLRRLCGGQLLAPENNYRWPRVCVGRVYEIG